MLVAFYCRRPRYLCFTLPLRRHLESCAVPQTCDQLFPLITPRDAADPVLHDLSIRAAQKLARFHVRHHQLSVGGNHRKELCLLSCRVWCQRSYWSPVGRELKRRLRIALHNSLYIVNRQTSPKLCRYSKVGFIRRECHLGDSHPEW